jgi:hypothetical protein
MPSPTSNRMWRIQVCDGTAVLYEKVVKFGQITEPSMKALLKTLVAKHSLDNDEIVGCYAKRRTSIHSDNLPVTRIRDTGKYGFSCGDNPFALAVLVKE